MLEINQFESNRVSLLYGRPRTQFQEMAAFIYQRLQCFRRFVAAIVALVVDSPLFLLLLLLLLMMMMLLLLRKSCPLSLLLFAFIAVNALIALNY